MHDLSVHEALLLLETDPSRGLSEAEAARRLERFGPNVLPRVERRGALQRFALQFNHPLIYVLMAAAIVTLLIGEPVDASVIAGVVLINAVIGFVQETRAERALEALAAMLATEVTVVRDGAARRIDAAGLVPGDLVAVASGDAVVADLRLIEVRELQVDESALTGESAPARKAEAVLAPETVVADRANMAFAGTLVTGGECRGVVVATAGETEIGLIHRLVGEATEIATPLTRKIAHFSKVLTWAILALAGVTYLVGLTRGEDPGDLLVAAVALAVGAIPEGLPAAMTITLAIGVRRMAQRRAIVRRLPAVETLGSTTVICTDKTGTLTENQMTVQAILAGGRTFAVTGTGYQPAGEIVPDDDGPDARLTALRECLTAGALCNDARVMDREGRLEVVGDPTEAALLVAAAKGGIDPDRIADEAPRLDALPFESERQFMATLHGGAASAPVVYVKGAVERVVAMCSGQIGAGGASTVLDPEAVLAQADLFGARGLRVLAIARGALPAGVDRLPSGDGPAGLSFLGLQAMMDPPRPEAVAAVAACQQAGIAVKMITGDHASTARAIADQIGLDGAAGGDELAPVMSGTDIAACSPAQLQVIAPRTSVFARVSPEQKLRLVEALQAGGQIVAMTGDGVNDAPALKQADIGVAMGLGGTEVAREASDIVLTDDNFASIEAAVEEGRRTFDNLTKFIVWTLPTNIGEGLLIFTAIAAGITLPILPVQILWINMTTAVALGLMLAFEPKEPGIMQRPPRPPAQPLLTGELLGRILLVSTLLLIGSFGLFQWEQARDVPLAEARTVAVNVFVIGELFYLFNCRSLERSMFHIGVFSNPWVSAGVATMIVLQLLFTYATPMNSLFHSAPIDAEAWARIIAVGVVLWGAVGLEKWVRRRRRCTGKVQVR